MHASIQSLLAMLALANAQTTTTGFFMEYFDQSILSVVTATAIESDASATTYLLGCGSQEATENCGPPFTFTEGPSTYAFHSTDHNTAEDTDFTVNVECSLEGSTQAICTESFGGTEANFPGITTETYSSDAWVTLPVVGVATSSLASATSTSAIAPGSTPTSSRPLQTASSTQTTRASASPTSTQAASASSSNASSAAVARIIAGPGWVVGAGALAALVAL